MLKMNWKFDHAGPFKGVSVHLIPSNGWGDRYAYYSFRVDFSLVDFRETYKIVRMCSLSSNGHNLNSAKKAAREWMESRMDEVLQAHTAFEQRVLNMRGPGAIKLIDEKVVLLAKINANDARFSIQMKEYYRKTEDARNGRRMKSVVTDCWTTRSRRLRPGRRIETDDGDLFEPGKPYIHIEHQFASRQVPDYPDPPQRSDDNVQLRERIAEIDAELMRYGILEDLRDE